MVRVRACYLLPRILKGFDIKQPAEHQLGGKVTSNKACNRIESAAWLSMHTSSAGLYANLHRLIAIKASKYSKAAVVKQRTLVQKSFIRWWTFGYIGDDLLSSHSITQ